MNVFVDITYVIHINLILLYMYMHTRFHRWDNLSLNRAVVEKFYLFV